jgi:hypothetical protein
VYFEGLHVYFEGLEGRNFIVRAARNGNLAMLKLLFTYLSDDNKNTLLTRNGTLDLSNGKKGVYANDGSLLDQACLSGNDEVFKFLVRELNLTKDLKVTLKNPLNIACFHRKRELVKWLLDEMHFDVNFKFKESLDDVVKITPFDVACSRENNLEVIEELLAHKNNDANNKELTFVVDFKDAKGTPAEILDRLLAKGAQIKESVDSGSIDSKKKKFVLKV